MEVGELRKWAISYFGDKGSGIRLGVKDLIDVEGTRTSAGSRLVLSRAEVAERDATVVDSARKGGAQIVAKTNLNELAFGTSGINPWFGTPENPLNRSLIPGGSSSGSAVGVALGELDAALGSDTGGSIRIPSACCGVVGLKTTAGRIPLEGVRPLAPSLDTVGPIARDAKMIEAAMGLLLPGFAAELPANPRIGVIARSGSEALFTAIVKALSLIAGEVEEVGDLGLESARESATCILMVEALSCNRGLISESHRMDPAVATRFASAARYSDEDLSASRVAGEVFRSKLQRIFTQVDFLALPTLRVPVPTLAEAGSTQLNANTLPFNLAGLPAISVPVRLVSEVTAFLGLDEGFAPMGVREGGSEPMPLAIQIVGKAGTEEQLVGLAQMLESGLEEL